ncbi:MAG: Amide hydrolase [Bradyrhizobium sp.]|nr:Amide hydrolase [Bradyrhizobium sp.]
MAGIKEQAVAALRGGDEFTPDNRLAPCPDTPIARSDINRCSGSSSINLSRRAALAGLGLLAAGMPRPARSAAGPRSQPSNFSAVAGRARALGMLALNVQLGGEMVFEYGTQDKPSVIHSMRKAFLSGLYGEASARGVIDLHASVGDCDIEDDVKLTDVERSATILDLLTARSGVYLPLKWNGRPDPSRPTRGQYRPGEHWYYDNWAFNVLGNIYERKTQKSVYIAIDHFYARPLGFRDWDVYRDTGYAYANDPIGGNLRYPNFRMSMSARDLARFGQLYLQNGKWNGQQIIPADWIGESIKPAVRTGQNGSSTAYGYLWWIVPPGQADTALPAGSYSALGAGGQFVTVAPAINLVIVGLIDWSAPGFKEIDQPKRDALFKLIVDAVQAT